MLKNSGQLKFIFRMCGYVKWLLELQTLVIVISVCYMIDAVVVEKRVYRHVWTECFVEV